MSNKNLGLLCRISLHVLLLTVLDSDNMRQAYDQIKILLPVLGRTLRAKILLHLSCFGLLLVVVRCASEMDQKIGHKIIAAKLARNIVQHCSEIMTNIRQITKCKLKVANDNF